MRKRYTGKPKERFKNYAFAWVVVAILILGFIPLTLNMVFDEVDEPTPVEESITPSPSPKPISVESPEPIIVEEEPSPEPEPVLDDFLGQDTFEFEGHSFKRFDLPDVYYGDQYDYSYFQCSENYHLITNKRSAAYPIVHSENAYTDSNGFRRYSLTDDDFSIDGKDDYMAALGTFYKPKGTAGSRYLIVTSTGKYTLITGDEKADAHTDPYHMFSIHGANRDYADVIEFIVDSDLVDPIIHKYGTVTKSDKIPEFTGELLYIYGIDQ